MAEKKGFKEEFKEFVLRGNVMDMAVGLIIGSAFTAIVNSLVEDIIMPVVGMALGGLDFSQLAVTVGSANIAYGKFIQAIISFLLIALVLFWIVKTVNKVRKPVEEAAPEPSDEAKLLGEILEALKKK